MSALVLDFKQPKVKGTQPRLLDQPRYFCKLCDSDRFAVLQDGRVVCDGGHPIKNLLVAEA